MGEEPKARWLDLTIRDAETDASWPRRVALDKPTVSLGRNADRCDVVLDVPRMGPARVELYPRDDAWLVVRVVGGPSDFPSGRIVKNPFDEDVPVAINGRPHGGAVVFDDVFPTPMADDGGSMLLRRGDELTVGPFQITLEWEGAVGAPLAIAQAWLPGDPVTTPGRFGACMPNTDGSLTHQIVVGRGARNGDWRVYAALAVGFDYPKVRVYLHAGEREVVCIAHSYAFYWTTDDGRAFRAPNGEQRATLGYSKFGSRKLGPVRFEGNDMLVHVVEHQGEGPVRAARVVDGDVRVVEGNVTVDRFRLPLSGDDAPRLEARTAGADARALLSELQEASPAPGPALVPLRVREQRHLEYMQEHAWHEVPLLEMVRAFRDRTGLLL